VPAVIETQARSKTTDETKARKPIRISRFQNSLFRHYHLMATRKAAYYRFVSRSVAAV
jgi:hypothetical protein